MLRGSDVPRAPPGQDKNGPTHARVEVVKSSFFDLCALEDFRRRASCLRSERRGGGIRNIYVRSYAGR